jgi:hypothetical protein
VKSRCLAIAYCRILVKEGIRRRLEFGSNDLNFVGELYTGRIGSRRQPQPARRVPRHRRTFLASGHPAAQNRQGGAQVVRWPGLRNCSGKVRAPGTGVLVSPTPPVQREELGQQGTAGAALPSGSVVEAHTPAYIIQVGRTP